MVRPRVLPLLLAAATAASAASGCGPLGLAEQASPGRERTVRVDRVVDGDTLASGDERIRLIGVDTPETKKPGTPVQCFGRQDTALTEELVEGRRVGLELDVEERDRYGRLLAYVHRASDDLDLNAELVRRGYALQLTIPPNVRHADRYRRLARRARERRLGLWSTCRG